jgi:chemotaxis protein MotB
MEGTRPIIIIKKKAGHGGHHGGACEAIAGYFRDPAGTAGQLGTSTEGPGEKFVPTPVPSDEMAKLKDQIEKAMRQLTQFRQVKGPD